MNNNSASMSANTVLLVQVLDASESRVADDFPGLLRLGDGGCSNIITLVVQPLEQAAQIMVQHRGHCGPDDHWPFARCVSELLDKRDIDEGMAGELLRAHEQMHGILSDHQCIGRELNGVLKACPDGCVSLAAMPAPRAEQLSNCILIARRFRAQLRTQLTGHLA